MFLLFPPSVASDSGYQLLSHLFVSLDLFLAKNDDSMIRTFSQLVILPLLLAILIVMIGFVQKRVTEQRKLELQAKLF